MWESAGPKGRAFSSEVWPTQRPDRCHSFFGAGQNRFGCCAGLPQRNPRVHCIAFEPQGVARMVMCLAHEMVNDFRHDGFV